MTVQRQWLVSRWETKTKKNKKQKKKFTGRDRNGGNIRIP